MLEGIRWFKQSAFLFEEASVYIDPWGVPGDAPPARAVMITHAHGDHFSMEDIRKVTTDRTVFVAPLDVADALQGEVGEILVVSPGDAFEVIGYSVDAVPAYNVKPDRLNFHPKNNNWVGYVIAIGGVRYYHAGDTDLIPDMEPIHCDVAFLPIGGTYTMDPGEAAEAAKILSPKMAVPMHYGFVVGSPTDARYFRESVGSGAFEMTPERPFELG